jgi:hypothetical protein
MKPPVTASLTVIVIVDYVLAAVRVGLIVAGCAILYRALRLAALPWIAAWYVVRLVADSSNAYFFRHLWGTPQPPPPPLVTLVLASDLAAQLSLLLVVLLVFAEAAFILQRLEPAPRFGLFRILAGTHRYVRLLGIATLLLAILAPCVPMIYYYAHGPVKV